MALRTDIREVVLACTKLASSATHAARAVALADDSQFAIIDVMLNLSESDSFSMIPRSEVSCSHARIDEWIRSNSREVGLDVVPDLEDLQSSRSSTLPVDPVRRREGFELLKPRNRRLNKRREGRESSRDLRCFLRLFHDEEVERC